MREIKFRAWSIADKVMIYDLNTPFLFHGKLKSFRGDILMQFTGLKDKNEVEIFEGDIIYLESTGCNYEVFYSEKEAAFILDCLQKVATEFFMFLAEWGEPEYRKILGNIHENKDLL